MFSVNDTIHYAGSGVCRIQEISTMRFGRTREQYYVLKPLHQNTSVIYVPLKNEQLVAKMRPMLSCEQAEALIARIGQIEPVWNDDINQRKLQFDEMLRSGSCEDLVSIIKSLLAQRNRRLAEGKMLHVSDENYLREAQRLLFDELAGVLGVTPKDVEARLKDALNEA